MKHAWSSANQHPVAPAAELGPRANDADAVRNFRPFNRGVKRETNRLNHPNMNTKIELNIPDFPPARRAYTGPAPSLRIATTRKNKSLLRWMRAAELSAWQEADARQLTTLRTLANAGFPQPLFSMNSH